MPPTDSDLPDLPDSDVPAPDADRPSPPLPDAAEPPERVCKNCGNLLAPTDQYCGSCRQKYAAHPASLWELFADFFETVFNLDNRVLQSLLGIFIPGRLTNHFMQGMQRRYMSPIRFFFVSAIVCFACVGFAIDGPLDKIFAQNEQQQVRTAFHDTMIDEVRVGRDSVVELFDQNPTVEAALDSLLQVIGGESRDTLQFGYFVYQPGSLSFTVQNVPVSAADVVLLPMDQLLDQYEVEGFWNRLQLRQVIKISSDGGNASRFLLGQMIWAVLIILPFLALWLKLLYIRRDRYYVEHFVFTLHVHSFVFVLYTLALLLYLAFGWTDPIGFTGLLVGIYFYLSLYRVYRQGWFKTLVKFGILGISYWFFLAISFLLTVVVSVLLY